MIDRPEDIVGCIACGKPAGDSCKGPRSHPARITAAAARPADNERWLHEPMKHKYMFMYAKDVTVPPRSSNTAVEHFRTKLGFFWFLARSKPARDAIRANRFVFVAISNGARYLVKVTDK